MRVIAVWMASSVSPSPKSPAFDVRLRFPRAGPRRELAPYSGTLVGTTKSNVASDPVPRVGGGEVCCVAVEALVTGCVRVVSPAIPERASERSSAAGGYAGRQGARI